VCGPRLAEEIHGAACAPYPPSFHINQLLQLEQSIVKIMVDVLME
jgi:hypothetical protein